MKLNKRNLHTYSPCSRPLSTPWKHFRLMQLGQSIEYITDGLAKFWPEMPITLMNKANKLLTWLSLTGNYDRSHGWQSSKYPKCNIWKLDGLNNSHSHLTSWSHSRLLGSTLKIAWEPAQALIFHHDRTPTSRVTYSKLKSVITKHVEHRHLTTASPKNFWELNLKI